MCSEIELVYLDAFEVYLKGETKLNDMFKRESNIVDNGDVEVNGDFRIKYSLDGVVVLAGKILGYKIRAGFNIVFISEKIYAEGIKNGLIEKPESDDIKKISFTSYVEKLGDKAFRRFCHSIFNSDITYLKENLRSINDISDKIKVYVKDDGIAVGSIEVDVKNDIILEKSVENTSSVGADYIVSCTEKLDTLVDKMVVYMNCECTSMDFIMTIIRLDAGIDAGVCVDDIKSYDDIIIDNKCISFDFEFEVLEK